MNIIFDPMKSRRNIALRGLSFERAAEMDFETALIVADNRHDYGEERPMQERHYVMTKRSSMTDKDGEVRELTVEDFQHAKRFENLPKDLQNTLQAVRKRGPQRAPTKEMVTIRLSKDVVEHFRATGPGWQSRVDEVLKKAVEAGAA
ncbi:BrnA antitoxin family protein [Eoetvoesiella caeni]